MIGALFKKIIYCGELGGFCRNHRAVQREIDSIQNDVAL